MTHPKSSKGMTIQSFIEKAIAGGWEPRFNEKMGVLQDEGDRKLKVITGAPTLSHGDMFLDPASWRAVGKVEGWDGYGKSIFYKEFSRQTIYSANISLAEYQMHRMIDAFAEGKTITEFLEFL